MPEPAGQNAGPQDQNHTPPDRVLLVLIAKSHAVFDEIITILLDVGVSGTVIDSKGLMALIREELPVFTGLASMVPETTGSRVVLSVTTPANAEQLFEALKAEIPEADRPIVVTLPVHTMLGITRT
jgi:hypothetical protein